MTSFVSQFTKVFTAILLTVFSFVIPLNLDSQSFETLFTESTVEAVAPLTMELYDEISVTQNTFTTADSRQNAEGSQHKVNFEISGTEIIPTNKNSNNNYQIIFAAPQDLNAGVVTIDSTAEVKTSVTSQINNLRAFISPLDLVDGIYVTKDARLSFLAAVGERDVDINLQGLVELAESFKKSKTIYQSTATLSVVTTGHTDYGIVNYNPNVESLAKQGIISELNKLKEEAEKIKVVSRSNSNSLTFRNAVTAMNNAKEALIINIDLMIKKLNGGDFYYNADIKEDSSLGDTSVKIGATITNPVGVSFPIEGGTPTTKDLTFTGTITNSLPSIPAISSSLVGTTRQSTIYYTNYVESGTPDAPSDVVISKKSNGFYTLRGTAQQGTKVHVTNSKGISAETASVDAGRQFTLQITDNVGEKAELAYYTMNSENKKSNLQTIVTPDETPPAIPTQLNITGTPGAYTISGYTEPGAFILIEKEDGSSIISRTAAAIVSDSGEFSLSLGSSVNADTKLNVYAEDQDLNKSEATKVSVNSFFIPLQPSILSVKYTKGSGYTLQGVAETGTTILATKSDNDTSVSAPTLVDAADGIFELNLDASVTQGDTIYIKAVNTARVNSEEKMVTMPDLEAPEAPSDLKIKWDKTTNKYMFTGKTEADSSVVITHENAQNIEEEISLEEPITYSGENFTVYLPKLEMEEELLSVYAIDQAGNKSEPSNPIRIDYKAPLAPTHLAFKKEGSEYKLHGEAEPGAKITVTHIVESKEEEIASRTAEVDEHGKFVISFGNSKGIEETLSVYATDEVGNQSEAKTFIPDYTAPILPEDVKVIWNEETMSYQLVGKKETDTAISIWLEEKEIALIPLDGESIFSLELAHLVEDGSQLSIYAIDAVGHESAKKTILVDMEKPDAPTNVELKWNEPNYIVTGQAEAGSKISIKTIAGEELVTGDEFVANNGQFTTKIKASATGDGELKVTAIDEALNRSIPAPLYGDFTAPNKPEVKSIKWNGEKYLVTATAEAGVFVYNGSLLAEEKTAGQYELLVDKDEGDDGSITLYAKDAVNNRSEDTSVYINYKAPAAATEVAIVWNNLLNRYDITGNKASDSSVVVKLNNTVVAESIMDAATSFTASTENEIGEKKDLLVYVVDRYGNSSDPYRIQTPDHTAPHAPTALSIIWDSVENQYVLTGHKEENSMIVIEIASNSQELKRIESTPDTNFRTVLDEAIGELVNLKVYAIDEANNRSDAGVVKTPDHTPPDFVTNVMIRWNDSLKRFEITGNKEQGSAIFVKTAADQEVGFVNNNSSEAFSVAIASDVQEKVDLYVYMKDAYHNLGPAYVIQTPDHTPPPIPNQVVIRWDEAANQYKVTGMKEAGSAIKVKLANGTVIAQLPASSDSAFEVFIPSTVVEHTSLYLSAMDDAGNSSEAKVIQTPDHTPPSPSGNIEIYWNSVKNKYEISGSKEGGAAVLVTTLEGVKVAEVEANDAKIYKVEIEETIGENVPLKVVIKDKSNNISSPVTVTTPIRTTLPAPTNVLIKWSSILNEYEVTGNKIKGAGITIKTDSGLVLATVQSNDATTFKVNLNQSVGEKVSLAVYVKGNFDHLSQPSFIQTPDHTAPLTPTNLKITGTKADGFVITGQGEVNSSIVFENALGTVIGMIANLTNASFNFALPKSLNEDQTITIYSVDEANNKSNRVIAVTPKTEVIIIPPEIISPPIIEVPETPEEPEIPEVPAPKFISINGLKEGSYVLTGKTSNGANKLNVIVNGHLLKTISVEKNGFKTTIKNVLSKKGKSKILTYGDQIELNYFDEESKKTIKATTTVQFTNYNIKLNKINVKKNNKKTVTVKGTASKKVEKLRVYVNKVSVKTVNVKDGKYSTTIKSFKNSKGKKVSIQPKDVVRVKIIDKDKNPSYQEVIVKVKK